MTNIETFSLSETISQEIYALVKAGFFSSKSDLAREALRCLFEHKPELKVNAGIQLYKEEKVSLGRAAEIAQMNVLDFKEVLIDRGLLQMPVQTKKHIEKGIKTIKKLRTK